jgi:ribosomal protein S2
MKFSLQFKTLFSLRAFLSPYVRAWNPYFFRFIAGKRYRYAIIDVNQFSILFKSTFAFLRQTLLNGGRFYYFNPYQANLFVTHSFGLELSQWTPGIFTNKLAMKRIRELKQMPFFFPSALFLLNLEVKNVSFAKEAKSLLVPTVAMMGAYFNHQLIDYPLLSNPSARLSTYIIEASRQMASTLFIDWALEYSLKRHKYIKSADFIKKPTNYNFLTVSNGVNKNRFQNQLLSLKAFKQRSFSPQEFISFHFRSFRWFSDRYKRVWSSLLYDRKKVQSYGRKNNKRFKKRPYSKRKNLRRGDMPLRKKSGNRKGSNNRALKRSNRLKKSKFLKKKRA